MRGNERKCEGMIGSGRVWWKMRGNVVKWEGMMNNDRGRSNGNE